MLQPEYDQLVCFQGDCGVDSTATPLFCGNAERGLKRAIKKRVQYSSPNEIRRPLVLLSVT
jgi:hypothetical protein